MLFGSTNSTTFFTMAFPPWLFYSECMKMLLCLQPCAALPLILHPELCQKQRAKIRLLLPELREKATKFRFYYLCVYSSFMRSFIPTLSWNFCRIFDGDPTSSKRFSPKFYLPDFYWLLSSRNQLRNLF